MMTFREGQRVYVSEPIERYPHFIAPPGFATIAVIQSDGLWLLYDEHVPGAEKWSNEIMLEPEEWLHVSQTQTAAASILERAARLVVALLALVGVTVTRRERHEESR